MSVEKPIINQLAVQKYSGQSGFTLIETLVSLVVISVGILAFALLQAESLRATHVSMQRTKAIHFATDILERMRANKLGATAYKLAPLADAAVANCSDIGVDAIDCTAYQLSRFDVWEWNKAIQDERGGIVGGTATIDVVPVAASATPIYEVSIVISWDDRDKVSSYTLDTVL